jgi:hypothetical protein
MRFMCLVYIDSSKISKMTPEEGVKLTDDTLEEDKALLASGKLLLAQPLAEPETAVTLRIRNGKISSTDGPFAETKEHLGGLFFIEAADQAEAIAIAGTSAILKYGSIEVRPVHEQSHSVTGEARPRI